MIPIMDDDEYVIGLRTFYAKHKRPPGWGELDNRHGLHTSSAYLRHFGGNSMDAIYGEVLGIETIMQAVERFIRLKSNNGTKDFFYAHSKEIAEEMKLPYGKVRACIAGLTKSNMPMLGGYSIGRYSKGCSTHFVYRFERLDSHERLSDSCEKLRLL